MEEAVQGSRYHPMPKTLFCSAGTVTAPLAICKFAIPFANRADRPPSPVGRPRFTVLKSVVHGQRSPHWTGRIPRCSFPHSKRWRHWSLGSLPSRPQRKRNQRILETPTLFIPPRTANSCLDIFQIHMPPHMLPPSMWPHDARIWDLKIANPFATGLFEANDETGQRTNTTSDTP